MSLDFLISSILMGVGLAMDAFSVSMVAGLTEPDMKTARMLGIAGTFCGFQILMPMIGWFLVHEAAEHFAAFRPFIPWIALLLLLFIGGKMLLEGLSGRDSEKPEPVPMGLAMLMLQGIATSIDALSVGFTIADYTASEALTEALVIGIVTFLICEAGVRIGRHFGTRLSGRSQILGGIILIAIGIRVFIAGVL